MAYAAVASLSETIHLILNYHQDSISPQLKNQITSLDQHIIFLRSFLDDSPDEALTWEERIGEVTNKAEDIIELLLSDSLLDSVVGSSKPKFKYHFDELERVTEEVESIVRGVRERHRETGGSFNDETMQIIDRLCGGPRGRQVFSIVGSGGIGKTTLAKNVFNHPLIVKHFSIRAWITVSQNYSWRGFISALRRSMCLENNIRCSDDEWLRYVRWKLLDKRYLIVLDDIWSVEVWDQLQYVIPHNSTGSRVLITTRVLDVASWFCSPIHEMCSMNVDQSWNLLRHKIFQGDPCPPKLEYIGKMIARSCRGLPLAIEVVSGILAAHQTQAAWEDVAENVKTAINCEHNEHILHILYLSYTYLPHHLRPCFLYLGIFPEDYEIRVSKLIKLWEVEGFLNESGCKSSESRGEEYLEDLVKRSLVSVSKRKCNGRIKSLSIHDLVRDFCTRQAQVDRFFLHVTKFLVAAEAIQLQRRVSVADYHNFHQNVNCSTIRTVICLENSRQGIGIRRSLKYFRLLQILDLSEDYYLFFNSNELPNHVFEQFHLRYLAFDWPFSSAIPKAISNLGNLQTLIIRPRDHKRRLVELPVEILRMRQLRHLIVHSCVLTSQEEESIFALENLQTLTEAVDVICSRETLEMIPNLKKLGIFYTKFRDPEDYQLYNLIHFQKLEILKIELDWSLEEAGQRIIPLAFPPTLRKLSLRGLRLSWEDMKIVASLPNLQKLKLRDHACVGSRWETNEGGFSQLNFLLISRLDVQHWITKSSHLPKLKCLVLRHNRYLRKLPNDIGQIQTLELIGVDEVNSSLMSSAKCIQEDQQSLGNYSLEVRVLPVRSN